MKLAQNDQVPNSKEDNIALLEYALLDKNCEFLTIDTFLAIWLISYQFKFTIDLQHIRNFHQIHNV